MHYAGHAFFDEDNPERSGILCHHHVVLSGADLADLAHLPLLVFFNTCESGRLRKVDGRVVPAGARTPPGTTVLPALSPCQALLRPTSRS